MSYTSISDVDPWPDACPSAASLTTDELLAFLEDRDAAELTTWEWKFCGSIESQLLAGRRLSPKQCAVFDKGLLKALYDADPAIWVGIE